MTIGICRYCGKQKKLCKAHIIPRRFYNVRNEKYISISVTGEVDLKKSQSGWIDSNILCSECDGVLGCYDKYAKELLKENVFKNKSIKIQTIKDGKIYHLKKEDFDYYKLRKFFISLAWRASISGMYNVTLGKYENIALRILKEEIPDDLNLFFPIVTHLSIPDMYSDSAVIRTIKLKGQKGILIAMPNYRIALLTSIYPIKHERIIKNIPFNQDNFLLIETKDDLFSIQDDIFEVFKSCIKNNPNIMKM